MKPIKTVLMTWLCILAMPVKAQAIDKHPNIGIINETVFTSQQVGSNCHENNGVILHEGMAIALSGTYYCKPDSYQEKAFYVGYYGENRFFVPQEKIFVSDEIKPKLSKITEYELTEDNDSSKELGKSLRLYDIREALDEYRKKAVNGIVIEDFHVYDESEYTEATGFKIKVTNPTKKAIKYVILSVVGLNAVNDVVHERYSGKTTHQFRGIGPIAPNESGTYTFENVWFTDTVETARIKNLKVQYMNGSTIVVKNPNAAILSQKTINTISYKINEQP